MKPEPVNFADEAASSPHQRPYRSHIGLLSLFLVLAILSCGIAYLTISGSAIQRITNQSFFQQIAHLVTNKDRGLKGEQGDRVNILLLGIGGPGHEGAYLTDTIIVVSLKPSTKQIALLSVPRDLAVELPNGSIRKINAANSVGRDLEYPGGGEMLTAKVVSDVIGMPINYFARIDFAGFTKLIDDLGGVQVTVDQSFTDREYPTKNFGYQTIGFKAGQQRMNGDLSLKFVRSRHGNNGEGSDFARARRQQKVLSALKGKLFTLSLLTSPQRLALVLDTFGDHTRTNLEIWEMLRVSTLVRSAQPNMISRVLDSSPEGLLRNEVGLDGASLLVPRSGDFRQVQTLARNIFTLDAVKQEQSRIAIDYAATDLAVADQLSAELSLYSANVVRVSGGSATGSRTIVYDLTNGRKPFTRQFLSGNYEVKTFSDVLTGGSPALSPKLNTLLESQSVDFLILLGQTKTASTSSGRSNTRRSS